MSLVGIATAVQHVFAADDCVVLVPSLSCEVVPVLQLPPHLSTTVQML